MPFLGARGQASRGYFGGGTPPDAPTAVVATRGNTQLSVAFSAPAFNGGLDITTYQYALSTDSYATWTTRSTGTTASPLVITGLANGTSYQVKLRAVNALGEGAASNASTAVTPATLPGPPGTPTPTPNQSTQVPLSWSAAAGNGESITDYIVEYSTSATFVGGGTVFTDGTSASTSTTVTGLSNGTTYYFRVKAVNDVGVGPYSSISAGAVPATAPSAPVIGTSTTSDRSVTINWTASTSTGGAAVKYTVELWNSATGWSISTPDITGTSYTYTARNDRGYIGRVTASNSAGTSAVSGDSVQVYPAMVIPTMNWVDSSVTKYSDWSMSWSGTTGYTYQPQKYYSSWADFGGAHSGSGAKTSDSFTVGYDAIVYGRVKVTDPDGVVGYTNQRSVNAGRAAVYSVAGWGSESANKTYTQTVSTPVGVSGATYANGSSNGQGATEWGNATAISVVSTNQGTDRRVISVKISADKVAGFTSTSLTSDTRRLAVNLNGTVTREQWFDSVSTKPDLDCSHTLGFADSDSNGADGDRTASYGMRDTTTTWQSSTGTWRYSDNTNNFWASSRTTFVMTVTYRDRTWAASVETTAQRDSVYG